LDDVSRFEQFCQFRSLIVDGDALNLLTYIRVYPFFLAISAPRLTDLLTDTVEIFSSRASEAMLTPNSRAAQKQNRLRTSPPPVRSVRLP
jgi:hypothetical protein